MAYMHMPFLCLRAFRAGLITLQLFIIVPRYLNSSTCSQGLKLVLFFGDLPLYCRICIVLIFLALIVSPISFARSAISVRFLSRSEAGARNALLSAYATTFYFPSFPSSHMSKGPRYILKIYGEMRLTCGVPLLVLNLFSPMLMQFYQYKNQINDQVSSFICVTSLTLWSILL